MAYDPQIVRTKFIPPLPRKRLLIRPRLAELLKGVVSHKVTILQAGPGYGKSTVLAVHLSGANIPSFWYCVNGADTDPLVFITHLIWSLRSAYPTMGSRALSLLEEDYSPSARRQAVDLLGNDLIDQIVEDFAIVIDDYHAVAKSPEVNEIVENLINAMPPQVHVILSTRERPSLGSLARWRVRGEALEITERDLAFTVPEIRSLFSGPYQHELTSEQVKAVLERTEGWIIALEMIWHALREGLSLQELFTRTPSSLESVFDYLAQEVLGKQEQYVTDFLLDVSALSELDPDVCGRVSGRDDSEAILARLSAAGLFVYYTDAGAGTFRFHNLLRTFLRRQARRDSSRWAETNRKAAAYYGDRGQEGRVVDHLLSAGEYDGAAQRVLKLAPELVQGGRFEALAYWVGELPGATLEAYPDLLLRRADVYRLSSDYQNALAWYTMADDIFAARPDAAGRSRALKGKAMVYLDTVEPAMSESLLSEALLLLPEEERLERATLLRMMAESKTNQGQMQEALKLARAAEQLISAAMEDELDIRVHLRTGRLGAALTSLQRRAGEEQGLAAGSGFPAGPGLAAGPSPAAGQGRSIDQGHARTEQVRAEERGRPSRSHRETQLLLSLVYSLIGEGEKARMCAEAGIQLGRDLKSPFVEAVGYMRLGHACHISPSVRGPDAETCYRRALDICDQIRVTRGRAEPLMGLALVHAMSGDPAHADKEAAEALAICRSAGDEWLAGFVEIAMGAGMAFTGLDARAASWLALAKETFARVGDEYCATVCDLWLAVLALRRRDQDVLRQILGDLFSAVRTHSYEFLFTKRTLFGPRDLGVLAPLLVEAGRLGIDREHVAWLHSATGLPSVEYHPGYTLHVRTLGRFMLYRGTEEVCSREWQREKARSLFQLLVVNRKGYLHKDQILDALWPGLDTDVASSHFKVVFNAMLNVIEPGRPARLNSFLVNREGPLYGLNPLSGTWVDADEFDSLVAKAGRLAASDPEGACDLYRNAISLHRGDFLQESLYEDWAIAERERLLAVYLRAAQSFAELLYGGHEIEECIDVCESVLTRDQCWEEAYRLLMLCYLERGNRAMALRAYERCEAVLQSEMGMSPSRDMVAVLERVKRNM
jgi:ATP/maltotriose-dependent transcriptional regulator MalT